MQYNKLTQLIVFCLLPAALLAQPEPPELRVSIVEDTGNQGEANPGDVLEYTLTFTNTSSEALSGVSYEIALDPDLTVLGTEGRAVDDEYLLVDPFGEVDVPTAEGLITKNDDGIGLTVVSADSVSNRGGSVEVNTDGSFSFDANGHRGPDYFHYTVVDAFGNRSTAKVMLYLASRIFYFDNTYSGADGDGSLAKPFQSLRSAETNTGFGDALFLFRGNGSDDGQDVGLFVQPSQSILGQSKPLTMIDGNGRVTELPTTDDSRPVITRPIQNGSSVITAMILGGNNVLRGLQIGSMSEPIINNKAVFGRDFERLYARDISVANSQSYLLDLRNGNVDMVVNSLTNPDALQASMVNLDNCSGSFEVTGLSTARNQGLNVSGSVQAKFGDVDIIDGVISYASAELGYMHIESNGGGVRTKENAVRVIDASNFRLQGKAGNPFIIQGIGANGAGNSDRAVNIINSSDVWIQHIQIEGGTEDRDQGIVIRDSENLRIQDSIFAMSAGSGIVVSGGISELNRDTQVLISGNQFSGGADFTSNMHKGISAVYNSFEPTRLDIEIHDNQFEGQREQAVEVALLGASGSTDRKNQITVTDNVIYDTSEEAIYLEGQSNTKSKVLIEGNILDGVFRAPLATRGGSFAPQVGIGLQATQSSEFDITIRGNLLRDFERESIEVETRITPYDSVIRALVEQNDIREQSVVNSLPGIKFVVAGFGAQTEDRIDATIRENIIDISSTSISISNTAGNGSVACASINSNSGPGGNSAPSGIIRVRNSGSGELNLVEPANIESLNNGAGFSTGGVIGSVISCQLPTD